MIELISSRHCSRLRAYGLIALGSLLSACSTAPTQPATENSWGFIGKIGLWAYGEQESANIDWQDCENRYLVRLSGPLGVGSALIYGTDAGVSLHRGGEDTVHADSPEELLASMGWYLPVSSLRYWLRGLPSPQAPHQRTPEPDPETTALDQSGWHIEYSYQNGRIARIAMDNSQIRLKWIIRDWQDSVACKAP